MSRPSEQEAPSAAEAARVSMTVEDVHAYFEERTAERAARADAARRLQEMTAPATYGVGDYVTFVLLANVTATVRIEEMDAEGTTSYAFSDGTVGAYRDHRVLNLWRPATREEIELYDAYAVDHLGDRVVLPQEPR